jgi:hypothetical protein
VGRDCKTERRLRQNELFSGGIDLLLSVGFVFDCVWAGVGELWSALLLCAMLCVRRVLRCVAMLCVGVLMHVFVLSPGAVTFCITSVECYVTWTPSRLSGVGGGGSPALKITR